MDRLTHRDDQGMARIGFGGLVPTAYESKAAIDRLAAYEDTGLCPETTAQLKEIVRIFNCAPGDPAQLKWLCDKLRGWQQADQDGRLVVLPCKIGDAVWTIKNFKGHERARIGYVSEMYYTKYMKLFIVVKNTGRGFWGEGVFPSEAEAVAALERGKEDAT